MEWDVLQEEIRGLFKISGHNNVIDLVEFYESPYPCFVMAYVDGGTLRDHLRAHGAVSIPPARTMIHGIADGLQHLHSRDLVHSDLSTGNILLRRTSGEAVLLFKTREGNRDLPYQAPELLQRFDAPRTTASDMYALAIVVWVIFTGREPYGHQPMGLMDLQSFVALNNGRPPVQDIQGKITSQQMEVLVKCWASQPIERPQASAVLAVW